MIISRLGVTTGDPAGIGPEISLLSAAEAEFSENCLILFGSYNLLRDRAAAMKLPFRFERVTFDELLSGRPLPERSILDVPAGEIAAGTGSKASGEAAAQNILKCVEACLRGALDAVVTAPINKKYFQAAGYHFPGHTEFLAHLVQTFSRTPDKTPEIAMAFLADRLKVVLATIHDSMRTVVDAISPELIFRKLSIILTEFPKLGLPCGRVAVAGLNPHAGEDGLMGYEELTNILPGIIEARRNFPKSVIEGPLPGDTLFYRAYRGEFDVVLAMYHDQGLAPVKLIGFGESVNVTLGLPVIRTSVDHGTAYELAGKGTARHESMNSAIRWALRLIEGRRAAASTGF
ncbi:MAG: 4-hydroxythreonine-4-phosphate dehydrogenase PdxA [Acidobacteriota bacterium]|jgi:4-hydroxythreonine-4-phosphate dehydrogenase|nr:4-hydroxythreonine-4-phosphate dehydrogenase PdxA [Acidobacteriota bacterium]